MRTIKPLVFVSLVLMAACAGAQQTVAVVSSPFTIEHEAVFENGIDLVRDPRILEGQWLETWEEQLEQRIAMADVVALVTVRTLRTDVDLQRRHTYRLITDVDRVYVGERVGDELTLIVREGESGFGTVRTNERHLLDNQYLVFLKWAEDEDGRVRARWHLSPASEQVALRLRAQLRERGLLEDDSSRRVIIRRN
ncbi:MAG: hypothetical protein ACF8R9_00955 [Phycisphaerales bacterium JB054]